MRLHWAHGLDDEDQVGARTGIAPGKRSLTQGLPPSVARQGAGAPVEPAIAHQLGGMLHADLSPVRVHDDEPAHAASAALGARAFAHGHDIFLGAGEHAGDLALMAHELTHVVQQGGAATHPPQAKARSGGGAGGDLEREADLVAEHALRGDALDWLIGPAPAAPAVQAKREDDRGGGAGDPPTPPVDTSTRTDFLVARADLFLHREVPGGLRATPLAIRARTVVRGRAAPAGKRYPEFVFVVTAGELHGWAEGAHLEAVPPALVPDADAALGEGTPRHDLPRIGVDDYDQLAVMMRDAPLHAAPLARGDKTTPPLDTLRSMEAVVYLDRRVHDGVTWQQVRLLRPAPLTGWVPASEGWRIDPSPVAAGELTGVAELRLGSKEPAVRILETQLLNLGYGPGAPDEVFDAETEAAVKLFQVKRKMDDDGVVGPLTAAALRDARPVDGQRGVPAGSWRGGYQLLANSTGRALTPDGKPDAEGHGPAVQGGRSNLPKGPCEVLVDGDVPISVVDPTDGATCNYVRAAAARSAEQLEGAETADDLPMGGAGWVRATSVAGAGDGEATAITHELAQLCPDGITVVFVSNFDERASEQTLTFLREAAGFAAAHDAVAISGGQIVTGGVNLTTHKTEVVATLAGIQQALRGDAAEVPSWARVAHLAFFTHGWQEGLQTGRKDFDQGHLMNGGADGDDLEGFARTLTNFCHSDLEVSLFACSTGAAPDEDGGMWQQQAEPTGGEGAFADELADLLAAAGATEARVLGHTTIGHTTDNYAARIYQGGEHGGHNLFNFVAFPIEAWLQPELDELAAAGVADPAATIADSVWQRFRTIIGEDEPTQIATRMNTDPHGFLVEMRLRIKAWMPQRFFDLGFIPAAAEVYNKVAYPINVHYVYPPPSPEDCGKIPAGARVHRVPGIPGIELARGGMHLAVTWEGDPAKQQAYMGRGYMRVVLPPGA